MQRGGFKETNTLGITMAPLPIVSDCTNCGACCMHMRTPPHVVLWEDGCPKVHVNGMVSDADDFALLMAAPQEARDVMYRQASAKLSEVPDDAPCSWFDQATRQCRFHEFRPGICRDFVVGSPDCLQWRKIRGVA